MLFALFTAAGSSLLLMQTTESRTSAEPPAADQATAEPISAEPSATHVPLNWDMSEQPTASRPNLPAAPVGESARDESTEDAPPQALEDLIVPPYPTTALPPTTLPGRFDQPLPRVRTTDGPPAVAHLPGYVREVPPHQAYDDRNESSLH